MEMLYCNWRLGLMILKKCIMTESYNYQSVIESTQGSGVTTNIRFITPKGIVVHSTGTNASRLMTYVQPLPSYPDYQEIIDDLGLNSARPGWNTPDADDEGIHAFIGKNAADVVEVYQVMPYNVPVFGVANGLMVRKGAPYYSNTALTTQVGTLSEDTKGVAFGGDFSRINLEINNTTYYAKYADGLSYNYDPQAHIQFEICEDDLFDPEYYTNAMTSAKEYCAYLCVMFGWDASVIVSHKEAHSMGYGSNHGDCDNWLVRYDGTMDDFRADVQRLIDNMPIDEKLNIQSQRYKTDCEATL